MCFRYYSFHNRQQFLQKALPIQRYGYRSRYSWGFIWNLDFQSPWYVWNDGTNWNQVWADNELSISKKFDLAIENNLGGVGMWALNYDGDRPELWELINTKFGITAGVDEVGNNLAKIFTNPAKM